MIAERDGASSQALPRVAGPAIVPPGASREWRKGRDGVSASGSEWVEGERAVSGDDDVRQPGGSRRVVRNHGYGRRGGRQLLRHGRYVSPAEQLRDRGGDG